MSSLPIAQTLHRAGHWNGPSEVCTLDYDARFLRRKRLTTSQGTAFLVDLRQTASLNAGDALEIDNGPMVRIEAAQEALYQVSGPDLARLAWHIGNRHAPCQIAADHLLVQADPVIGDMLERLGATLHSVRAPFTPEGGAYGHGRTHSHEHGATVHAHRS